VFCNEFVDHGSRWGNTAQALDQWRHPVAFIGAQDVLHWSMHPALYPRIAMVTKTASNLPAFFVVPDYLFALNLR
jgi:hypothetical protein